MKSNRNAQTETGIHERLDGRHKERPGAPPKWHTRPHTPDQPATEISSRAERMIELLDQTEGANRVQLFLSGLDVVIDASLRCGRNLEAVHDVPRATL